MKRRIFVALGTRPEAIKLAPVILELKRQTADFDVVVCNTEQQKELSNQTLSYFGLKADYNLNVMIPNQTLVGLQCKISDAVSSLFDRSRFDAVIVQGDTMTVFACALTAFYHRIPVFHVEAGLRSYNLGEPFPEEALRQMVSRIATVHFAPAEGAVNALLAEGVCPDMVYKTGNTVIDALKCLDDSVIANSQRALTFKGVELSRELVLVTVHRRENHGERLMRILLAVQELAVRFHNIQFIVPVHPNPNVHDKVCTILGGLTNVKLTAPMDYPELVTVMKHSKLILTDSGGIQEEAPTFGVPVLVMRYKTERMEGVDAGFSKLVGADTDVIVRAAESVLSKSNEETRRDGLLNPYGDGFAARRICDAIKEYFNNREVCE